MGSDYYDRAATATSGGPAFATAEDGRNELAAMKAITAAWEVEVVRYGGRYNPIDFYLMRHGRIAAWLELKTRSHEVEAHKTVYLNLRKYLNLTMTFVHTGLPSYFAVQFRGGDIRWIDVADVQVDAHKIEVAGCRKMVKARTDREPVIHVPIADMHILRDRRASA